MRRSLTDLERALWLRSQNTPVNFALIAKLRGSFSLDALHRALLKLQARHPMAGVRIATDENQQPYYTSEAVGPIPVRVLERTSDADWITIIQAELQERFANPSDPLVRLICLQAGSISELILVCHHIASDGLSAVYFFRDLFLVLGAPESELAPLPELPFFLSLLPPDLANRSWELPAPIFTQTAPAPIEQASSLQNFCFYPWGLSAEEAETLSARAHQENTTAHGAFCAAFLQALAEIIPKPKPVIQSPVNIRERLAIGESYGLFITLISAEIDCAEQRSFWEIARDVRQSLIRDTEGDKVFLQPLILNSQMKGIDNNTLSALMQQTRPGFDISITNLGRLSIPVEYGSLRLEEIHGPALSLLPGELVLGIVHFNGKTNLLLSYEGDSKYGPSLVERAMKALRLAIC